MSSLSATIRPFPARFISTLCGLLLSVSALAQLAPDVTDVTGEASVVIFENLDTGEWELRHFIIDARMGLESEVLFSGPAPASFRTGAKVSLNGAVTAQGFQVSRYNLVQEAPAYLGGDTVNAPVANPETRNVLTILTDFNDAVVDGFKADGVTPMNYGVSLQEAKDIMYNNTKSVAGLFYNASLTTMTIPPDPDGDFVEDVFGPYQINDSYIGGDSSQCTASTWVNLASSAWQSANPGKDINIYRHRLLIVPNYWDWGNRHCGWGGVAQLGCGTWCWAIGADPDSILHGVIIHELGHNFGFHHARTDTNNDGSAESEYGDTSDMMGSSRNWMKFNAPHAEDNGWIDASEYEVRTITPSPSPQNFDLIAMDEEAWDWPGLRAIKVERTANTDYYISYRLAAGEYNNVSSGYRNKLNIHYGVDGSKATYFVTTLAAGETFNETHNNLSITATGTMNISGPAGNTTVMGVEICQDGCSSILAPSGLTATAVSTSAIDLAWTDESDNEDGFHIEHSTDGGSWSLLASQGGTTYTHGGLATASLHYYRVRAYNAGDQSGYSNVASKTTDAVPPSASFTWSNTHTEASFTDTSSDTDGTVVGWAWDFGDGAGSSTQNPVHTYGSGGDYTVELTVTDNHGATAFASELVTVEDPPFSDHLTTADLPSSGSVSGSHFDTHADDGNTESILERESGGRKSLRHSYLEHGWTFSIPTGDAATVYVNAWADASSDGDTFDFAWSPDNSTWTTMFNVSATSDPGTAQSFALPPGTGGTVYLRVTDTDQGEGNSSLDRVHIDELRIRVENATGTAPDGDPSNLSASADSHDQVSLAWDDGSSNESGFRILRREPGGSFAEVGQAGANADGTAGYTDSNGLSGGKDYEYQVVGFNLMGDSSPSNIASVTTDPAPAVVLSASGYKDKGKHTIDLSWTGSPDTIMEVYEGGSLLEGGVTGNAYTHATSNKGGGSYQHHVCVAGTSTCSNVTTTTF
jgi:PKD repeat protein